MRERVDGFEALMMIVATLLAGVFRELLLPRTDAGVAVQVVVVAVVGVVAFWSARRDREIRTFVLGCVIFTYAFFGLRAVH
jgi:hypothetical protein